MDARAGDGPQGLEVLTAGRSEQDQRRVAGALRARGLGTGDRLVLLCPGEPAYASVVLGAARSGVVPVPLDPRLTAWERERVLDDLDAALVVDDSAALRALLDGPPVDLAPDPLCRPMHFTSGTTGRPKGVWSGLLEPHDARDLVVEERELWGFRADDVDLVVSPIYHSAPLRFATGTLLAGGSIAVLPHFDAAAFVDAVAQVRPTTMFCVPAHLQRLQQHLDETGEEPDLSSFRLVAHAGAPCPEPVRRRAHAQFGVRTVWEFYGSTEGQWTACRGDAWHERPGSVGRARPGRVVTIDDEDQLWCVVPPWGRFTYWRDEEKTARAWRDTPDGPAFTVGDLGRVEDGWVYLDARRSDLVISGGVNVYPAEVEAALEDLPGVVEVAVFGRPDERWGQRVVAAYVGDADEETLRARALERLAPPKRPKEYLRLDALPRTATGKVRRTEL
ncbi:class I adenylate-forming enzyme family protein [Aeromicrobium sp.]|uniref:class I adenylate-forming enzyme family protein n=2 Tax=Aeromicrobium sp. TaxID=1871063 RepID=UPI003512D8DE